MNALWGHLGEWLLWPAWGWALYVAWSRARIHTMKALTVIDGDTFEMLSRNGKRYRIRLKDCDCPEIGQPMGEEIRAVVHGLIHGKWVQVTLFGRDRYHRHIGSVRLPDNRNLCSVLLKEGLAYPLPGRIGWSSLGARLSRKGVWGVWFRKAPWQASTRRKGLWGWVARRRAASKRRKSRR